MRLSIYKKMMIGYGIIIVVMIIVNAYVLYELNNVSEAAHTTLTSNVQAIDLAKRLQSILYEQERNGQKYVITRDHAYFGLFADDTAHFVQNLDSLGSMPLGREELLLVAHIRQQHRRVVATILNERALPSAEARGLFTMNERSWMDSVDAIHGSLTSFIRLNQLSIADAIRGVEATTQRSSQVAFLITVGTVILAVAAAFIITRTITRPIRTLIRGTQRIAHGDFTRIPISSRDEVGQLTAAVNDMSTQLNKVNELKEEMMQHIAHELRTPLATMLTAHYLLTEDTTEPLSPRQQRLLTTIRNGINKLTAFSHDFLDLSRIEAGMMDYHMECTPVVQFLRPLVDDAALTASSKRITVDLNAVDTPDIMIDKERFGHVISNLLSNAIKYTAPGGRITVHVAPSAKGVRIAVQDSGIGIPPEDLPRVFDKFYRVKSAAGSKVRGSGVGLALVKAVTKGHGGSVSAASTVGVGSTFAVELPAASDGPAHARTADAPVNQITAL